MLDRKQLPAFMKLPYQFEMEKILEAFEPFKDYRKYDDLNGGSSEAEYGKLCKEKRSLHGRFLHDKELKLQENEAYNSEYYKQLSLTEFDSKKYNIDPSNNVFKSYKISSKTDSKYYNPILDERNYTKKKDICTGYWNEILDTFKAPFTRTRFAYLAPHFSIKPHIDYNTNYSIRVHIPIITNKDARLWVKHKCGKIESIHCPADGGVYFMNTGLTHWASNDGSKERIHLVISLAGQEDLHEAQIL